MKKIALIALTCLLIGGGLAYLASYLIYTPELDDYIARINEQNNEMSRLVQMNCDLQHAVVSQEALLSTQQTEIETLKAETAAQKQIITSLEAELMQLKGE